MTPQRSSQTENKTFTPSSSMDPNNIEDVSEPEEDQPTKQHMDSTPDTSIRIFFSSETSLTSTESSEESVKTLTAQMKSVQNQLPHYKGSIPGVNSAFILDVQSSK